MIPYIYFFLTDLMKMFNLSFYFFFRSFTDLRTAFDLLDRNRDGRVTANELQFMLKNLGINVRDEIINDLIREASHSGKLGNLNFLYIKLVKKLYIQ